MWNLARHADRFDQAVARWMGRIGHPAHRLTLGAFFLWMGLLKVFGHKTGSSLLAQTVYLGSPHTMVPVLGVWEALIGLFLIVRPMIRVAILLLAIRVPATMLALFVKYDICFDDSVLVPTPEGQYILKDMMLFAAAMVVGADVRGHAHEPRKG